MVPLSLMPDLFASGADALKALLTIGLPASLFTVLVTKALDRSAARDDRVRAGYADSTRALVAFGELPYRIRRRTSDDPAVLAALAALGHDMQENLACNQGWVAGENRHMLGLYQELLDELRQAVGPAANAAWAAPRISAPSQMTLGVESGIDPVPTTDCVRRWSLAVTYRFGWRRVLSLVPGFLAWRLGRVGAVRNVE